LAGTTLKVERGVAVDSTRARYAGDLALNANFNTIGACVLDDAEIAGVLDFRNSRLKSAAIARGLAELKGKRGGRCVISVPGSLRDEPGDTLVVGLAGARVGRLRLPDQAAERPRGIVNLSGARITSYEDWSASWPPRNHRYHAEDGRDLDHLRLDGLVYDHLENPSGAATPSGSVSGAAPSAVQEPVTQSGIARSRCDWLDAQDACDVAVRFKPQPWRHLAQQLERQGFTHAATHIAVAERRRQRSMSASAYACWQNRVFDWFAVYGFNPWRTVVWMVAVVLVFATIFAWSETFCADRGCSDNSILIMTATNGYAPDTLARGYPEFHALAYSLDVFLPIIDLGYADHWRFNTRFGPLLSIPSPSVGAVLAVMFGAQPPSLLTTIDVTLGGLLYALVIFEQLAGLTLVILLFAGLSRGWRRQGEQ